MQLALRYGSRQLDLELPDDYPVWVAPSPAPLPDAPEALRQALDKPFEYPALRRALTPDDNVAVLVDERLPGLAGLLEPLLEHVASAGVSPEAITLLYPAGARGAVRPGDLSLPFRSVQMEVHDPDDRGRLAYLASTASGKRVYLNRTLVECSQSVILTLRRYDLLLGYGGAEGAIFAGLGDRECLEELASLTNPAPPGRFNPPGGEPWPTQREAQEIAWLLGQPFYAQGIPGPADTLSSVVCGAGEASREGQRRLDLAWRHALPRPADVVVATVRGNPAGCTFADLAAAVNDAARAVKAGGRIILLTEAGPAQALGPGTDLLRQEDDPHDALKALQKKANLETAPAIQWTQAACHARLAVLSGLDGDLVEELYATPLSGPGEIQKLLAGGSCAVLEDAHKRITTG
jgi:nickel-dependent lactate racemase